MNQLFLFECENGNIIIIQSEDSLKAGKILDKFLLDKPYLPLAENWKLALSLGKLSENVYTLPRGSFSL